PPGKWYRPAGAPGGDRVSGVDAHHHRLGRDGPLVERPDWRDGRTCGLDERVAGHVRALVLRAQHRGGSRSRPGEAGDGHEGRGHPGVRLHGEGPHQRAADLGESALVDRAGGAARCPQARARRREVMTDRPGGRAGRSCPAAGTRYWAMISTRRFSARPAAVLLEAIGLLLPKPGVVMRLGLIPFFTM